jgi:hypothetical protein
VQVCARQTLEESALSNDILKLSNGLLEHDKPFKLFDMKKFQNNVNREMKRQYPDRRYSTVYLVRYLILVPLKNGTRIRKDDHVFYRQQR